jgi:hypothetical protein
VVIALVATESVEVAEVAPEMVTEAGLKEMLGTDVTPLGPVTVPVRLTAPVKPPPGVTVIVLVPVDPAAMAAMLVPAMAIDGMDLTVAVTEVEAVTLPVTASAASTDTV